MRVGWTISAIERSLANGVTRTEANVVLAGPGQRLRIPINDTAYRIIGRTETGRLVEVWLQENGDEWEVLEAFEAGFDGQARWRNATNEE